MSDLRATAKTGMRILRVCVLVRLIAIRSIQQRGDFGASEGGLVFELLVLMDALISGAAIFFLVVLPVPVIIGRPLNVSVAAFVSESIDQHAKSGPRDCFVAIFLYRGLF